MAKILILFYSLTGHTATLAEEIAKGAREVDGVEVSLKMVPELIPENVLENSPRLKPAHEILRKYPVAKLEDMYEADGILLGSPAHFGSFAAQLKEFIDQLSPIWTQGKLVNKVCATFTSSGTIHGGSEATLLSLMIPIIQLGMIPVGVPFPMPDETPNFEGGSPYGATFVSGHDGDKTLQPQDAEVARFLGARVAKLAKVVKVAKDADKL